MEVQAYQKNIRTTPRKLRLVADAVREMKPTKALVHLQFMPKRAARVLHKVVKQAVRNAVNNHSLDENTLVFKHILIEEGPTYKRFRAAARGRARMIEKKTSHIKVVLQSKEVQKSADSSIVKQDKQEKKETKQTNKKDTKKEK
jgi:large subunit ribosomal protein L22